MKVFGILQYCKVQEVTFGKGEAAKTAYMEEIGVMDFDTVSAVTVTVKHAERPKALSTDLPVQNSQQSPTMLFGCSERQGLMVGFEGGGGARRVPLAGGEHSAPLFT